MNLWEETVREIEYSGHTLDDIDWIGCNDFTIDVDYYKHLAAMTEYHDGFGTEEVALDLVIVFKDNTWLSRDSYDGSEWFAYNAKPQKPAVCREPVRLANIWSSNLKAMQCLDEDGFPLG